jgi:Tfp pilus assembly protein PilF
MGPINPVQIQGQLARISGSAQFRATGRLRDFLHFIITETLEGRGGQIKEYTIGTLVYGRRLPFDPKLDSIVRVEAVKLRARLAVYYAQGGSADELVICVPRGGYVPEFHNRGAPLADGSAGAYRIAELCDIGSLALMRRTPTSIAVAIDCFVRARTLSPTDARPHLGLATGFTASLDIETISPRAAAADFHNSVSDGLHSNEDSGEAHVLRSLWLATVDGIGKSATAELARGIQLAPRNPAAHFWASGILSAQGEHEGSLHHFQEAIRSAPDCALLKAYLGRALYYAGRYRDALDVLEDVRSIDPALAVGYLWAALVWTELGRHDEAAAAGSRAVQLSTTSATLSANAYVLARGGQREEAERILESLTENPPYGYVSPLQLAVICEATGRVEEAAIHLDSARRENAWAILWQEVDARIMRLRSRIR